MAQALDRWRHPVPVASSEALDVLYRVIRPALGWQYRRHVGNMSA